MPLGVLDLWTVTERLIELLRAAKTASGLWAAEGGHSQGLTVTGLAPDAVRAKKDGNWLTVYLSHVAPDKFHRNTPPPGGRAMQIPQQPLALTLYYLVTAYSAQSYVDEQRAMSIALKYFHEHPFLSAGSGAKEFSLTIEPQTVDELGRLWQATTSPMRLSALYRVSVIFVEPAPLPLPEPKIVTAVNLDDPTLVPPLALADATITAGRRVIVTGTGFGAATTVVIVNLVSLKLTQGRIPPPGFFRVVSSTTIELQFPARTPAGEYSVDVRPSPGAPVTHVSLELP